MNLQNIRLLIEQLSSLGFENLEYTLVRKMAFKPQRFLISHQVEKSGDKVVFQLSFQFNSDQNCYAFDYFDAAFQKDIVRNDVVIDGINSTVVEKAMAEIDWRSAFDFESKKNQGALEKETWENEQKVESVIGALAQLEKSEEGRIVATDLKLKYWKGFNYQEVVGITLHPNSKSGIRQRFYFHEGEDCISAPEAVRFLRNRWLEMEVARKRKKVESSSELASQRNNQPSAKGRSARPKKVRDRGKGYSPEPQF